MPSDALFLKLVLCKLLKFDIKRCERAKPPVAPARPVAPVARAPAALAPTPSAVSPTISQPTMLAPATGKAPFAPAKAPANPNPAGPIKAPTTSPTKAPVGTASAVRLNEFHYENVGSDTVDYIEVRAGAGVDVSNLKVRYFGSGAELNGELSFSGASKTTDGLYDYYVWNLPADRLTAPTGALDIYNFATAKQIDVLIYGGTVGGAFEKVKVIEYFETFTTPQGYSLQRKDEGTWFHPKRNTKGANNYDVRVNEFHYENIGSDIGEFIEIRAKRGLDVSQMNVGYFSVTGQFETLAFTASGWMKTSDAVYDYYVYNLEPDKLALKTGAIYISDGTPFAYLDFVSYGGYGGGAKEYNDIGVTETSTTPVGHSLQCKDDRTWSPAKVNTKMFANTP
jgi:uncharacterized protein